MDSYLKEYPFDSVGDFLSILFYDPVRGEPDPRGFAHANAVARFLRGLADVKMSHILPLIYRHRCSYPSRNSARLSERQSMFSTAEAAAAIHHARPFISTWATQLVATEARKQIGRATVDDSEDEESRVQLRGADFDNFSMGALAEKFALTLPLPMYLTEQMAAPKVDGEPVVILVPITPSSPFVQLQVTALSSFILSRNPYATGYLAMTFGIWHFACKSHVDVKRIYCRLGNCIADQTARAALQSMTEADIEKMRQETELGALPVACEGKCKVL
ncbi:hypothetical protein R3P38DRAFT_3331169 [Favolaschia claudopus]|uniref:Uncharacterized protein n=1 Tax=Favolaschia claudopus TaxID=2862362 RepID=A0AAV9ZTP7_9AGAR